MGITDAAVREFEIAKNFLDEIEKLKKENARLREALERIENECALHYKTTWKIASDALEQK